MRRRSVLTFLGGSAIFMGSLASGMAQELSEELPAADALNYESLEQVTAIAESGPAIIYFHADWCPTCQATMTAFRARWSEVQPGITVIIADYDKESELKSRFGVSYQNTYVQVAADGSRIQSWNGGSIEALNTRPVF